MSKMWCEDCGWSGIADAARCEDCGKPTSPVERYDHDGVDGLLGNIPLYRARWHGGKRSIDDITAIVVHRYARGRGEAGPRYVQHPGGRHVSWHATAHHDGFLWRASQHLPVHLVAWHAGHRSVNLHSIGIEGDAALSGNVHDPWDDGQVATLIELIERYQELCPNLFYILGHHDIIPRRRSDPGNAFPWEQVCDAVDLEKLDHAHLSAIWA